MKNLLNYIVEKFNHADNGDEFYTQTKDIHKELSNYNLSGKTVYCNCDNPAFSKFYAYFKDNFSKLHLKKLMATYYSDDPKLVIYDGKNESLESIESGRFQDNTKYLKDCDIVITNPPYSDNMAAEFIDIMMKHKKDFIIVGPLALCVSKKVFPYLKTGQVNAGYTSINTFIRPDGTKANAPASWYTNIDVKRPKLKLTKTYDESAYQKYDNYDAIDCNPYSMIPKDYDGIMGVSLRFIGKLNRQQFKIVDKFRPKLNGKNKMVKLMIQKMED